MDLEEKLRMAKRFNYDNIKVDVDRFETRLFNDLSKNKHITEGRFLMKWKVASIVAVVSLVTAGAAFASTVLNVNEHTVSRLKTDVPPTSFITKGINNQNIDKVYSLSQARAVANFPIREPASISGWNHTESTGFLWKHLRSKATGLDAYFDVYTSKSGQEVTVQQSGGLDANKADNNNDGSKIKFNSDNTEANLYTTSSSGEKELLIIKKEPNNTITHIQIAGNVTADDLKTIGEAYITASDSK
jgi:hypothetical protein